MRFVNAHFNPAAIDGVAHLTNCKQVGVAIHGEGTGTKNAFYIGKGKGKAPNAAEINAVGLAPVGAKPGVYVADAMEVTAKITAINYNKRTATLALPDGTSQTIKVGKQVNSGNSKTGDDVTVE